MTLILSSLLALGLIGPQPVQRPLDADRVSPFNEPAAEGVLDIRLRVDGEVFVYLKESEVSQRIVSGGPLMVERLTFSQPIPRAPLGRFELDKREGRGDVELFEVPSRDNDYTATIRIDDDGGGSDLYHLRLSWSLNREDRNRGRGFGDSSRTGFFDIGLGRGVFSFRGRVDHVTAITIRGNRVRFEDFGGRRLRDERYDMTGPLPSASVDIDLRNVRGRGRVELVERPWEGNGYTAVVRIEDYSGGNADYSFDLEWGRR